MECTPLSTDFKDDILDPSNVNRKYKQIVNNDGTMSLQDETVYQQTGSVYGAKEINEERIIINYLQKQTIEVDSRLSMLEHMTLKNDFSVPISIDGLTTTLLVDDSGKSVVADWKYKEE